MAADLGIDPGVLQRRTSQVQARGADVFPGHGGPKTGDEDLLRPWKELARVQQERDFLGMAPARFTKERS